MTNFHRYVQPDSSQVLQDLDPQNTLVSTVHHMLELLDMVGIAHHVAGHRTHIN